MHIDARQLDNHSIIEGDICIVGAGAAGISMALEWIGSPYKVILLEGGGFEYDDKVQELYNGKLTGHPYFPMKASRLHYFGGSTGHWGGMCSTFDDIDFEPREWVENSGWPFKKEEIAAFYPRAHTLLDLGPYNYSVDYWEKQNELLKPLPLDKTIIWSKIWQFSPPTRFGKKYKDTIVNAKNIHLYTYANVVNISATESISAITDVTVKNYSDKEHTVRAKYFILACCAIQNSRLLLTSNKQAFKGLGNVNDLVGRYFMEHPEIKSGEFRLTSADRLKLYELDSKNKVRAELAVTAEKQRELKILNGTIGLMPLPVLEKMKPNHKSFSEEDPRKSLDSYNKNYEEAHRKSLYQRIKDRFSSSKNKNLFQSFGLYTRIEQVPNPLSRVMLSNEKDSLGVPFANLHWVMSPLDKRTVRKINELVGQQLGIANIGRLKLADFLLDETNDLMPDFTSGGWHHMGTTRINNDPKKGVVDANCKVHSIDNLYVAGSSCFPTGGAINPTLTVVAISLRLSDHLKRKIQNG